MVWEYVVPRPFFSCSSKNALEPNSKIRGTPSTLSGTSPGTLQIRDRTPFASFFDLRQLLSVIVERERSPVSRSHAWSWMKKKALRITYLVQGVAELHYPPKFPRNQTPADPRIDLHTKSLRSSSQYNRTITSRRMSLPSAPCSNPGRD